MTFFNPYNNLNLWIKHTFISFAQGYFSLDSKFTWSLDPQATKIIIADKFAVDLGVIDKRPAIILSRGGYGWTNTYRGQNGINAALADKKVDTLMPAPSGDRDLDFVFTDILRGSVTYNVLSKNGIEAEDIAHRLFTALSGYKKEFQKYGVHETSNLTIGDERIVRATSEIEAVGITVSLAFSAQKTIEKAGKLNNVAVVATIPKETTTGTTTTEVVMYETIDYTITNNGTTVEFVTAPADDTIQIDVAFVNAIDLKSVTSTLVGDLDGENTTYIIPSGAVYGYYTLNTAIIVSGTYTISGLTDYVYETTSGLTQTDTVADPDSFIVIVE